MLLYLGLKFLLTIIGSLPTMSRNNFGVSITRLFGWKMRDSRFLGIQSFPFLSAAPTLQDQMHALAKQAGSHIRVNAKPDTNIPLWSCSVRTQKGQGGHTTKCLHPPPSPFTYTFGYGSHSSFLPQVYSSATDTYDAMLNQSNTGANNNKFYVIQVVTDGMHFYTWCVVVLR